MKTSILASTLAFAALCTAQGVQAQQACVEPADLSDTITYALPILYDGMQTPCADSFAANPFMSGEADQFVDSFRMRQDQAWPGTLRLLKLFMAQRANAEAGASDQMADMISQLPDETLRPIVDVIVAQMVQERLVQEIKPTTCADVAEAMELLSPLPPENISRLATFVARQAELDDPQICKASAGNAAE